MRVAEKINVSFSLNRKERKANVHKNSKITRINLNDLVGYFGYEHAMQ